MTLFALLLGTYIGALLYEWLQDVPLYGRALDRAWSTAVGILLGWWMFAR